MPIEQTLERIADALEKIAVNTAGTNAAADPMPTATTPPAPPVMPASAPPVNPPGTPPPVDIRSPQQKAADTRKANKAAKDAAVLKAAEANKVVPIGAPAAPVVPSDPSVVLDVIPEYVIPGTLADLKAIANDAAGKLGPRINEIGELLAGTYQVSSLSELPVEYYAGFVRDLHTLITKPAA